MIRSVNKTVTGSGIRNLVFGFKIKTLKKSSLVMPGITF